MNITSAHWGSTDPGGAASHGKSAQHSDFSTTKLKSHGCIHHLCVCVGGHSATVLLSPAWLRNGALRCLQTAAFPKHIHKAAHFPVQKLLYAGFGYADPYLPSLCEIFLALPKKTFFTPFFLFIPGGLYSCFITY